MAVMKEHKIMSLEIGAKERMLQMKTLEMALAKEGDAAKKAELEKKLQALKAESEEYHEEGRTGPQGRRKGQAGQASGRKEVSRDDNAKRGRGPETALRAVRRSRAAGPD